MRVITACNTRVAQWYNEKGDSEAVELCAMALITENEAFALLLSPMTLPGDLYRYYANLCHSYAEKHS